MKRTLLIVVVSAVLLSMIFPVVAMADPTLTFFNNRADFEGVCPELQVEDFEEATINSGGWDVIARPVDNTINNDYFSPGDIEIGLSITTIGPDREGSEFALVGAGTFGTPSINLFAMHSADNIAVEFTNGDVTCVGIDLMSLLSNDPNMQIDIYGISGLLGSTTAPGTVAGNFWGVCSDEVITRIEIHSLTNKLEGVDNIAFGAEPVLPGWSKGKKSGWDGSRPPGLDKKDKTPPGFEQGSKNGWSLMD